MIGDLEADPLGEIPDRPLQRVILEGKDAATLPADRVVVMLSVRLYTLVAGHPARHLDPLQEAEALELLEGAVDARPADRRLAPAQLLVQLQSRDRTVMPGQRLDHRCAGAAAPVAGLLQRGEGVL